LLTGTNLDPRLDNEYYGSYNQSQSDWSERRTETGAGSNRQQLMANF
jgi:hypothetical protein